MKSSIPGGSTAAKLNTDTTAYPRVEAAGMADDSSMDGDNAGAGEVSVPAEALAVDGTAPETGDSVSFTVTGTVTRLDGNLAVVQMESVNDQPVKAPAGSEEDQLRGMAADSDSEMESLYT